VSSEPDTPLQTLLAPVSGCVLTLLSEPGRPCAPQQPLMLLESMKMEVPLDAPTAGCVVQWLCGIGDMLYEGEPVATFRPLALASLPVETAPRPPVSPPADSPALQRLAERRRWLDDAARPQDVARRHASGLRTARENVGDLLDDDSFVEYGGFAVAAQRSRRSPEELLRQTPADGLICGTGLVDGLPVGVLAYDYTVLAGTQGYWNHAKSDRLLDVAERQRLPLVWFAEGGGGRPGDVDAPVVAGLHCTTFARWAALSGTVPRLGIVAGRCFAGNAALLGCSDLVIAVRGASIGLGGPAMIEGGGLGRVDADAVGPLSVMEPNGVVDVTVDSEAQAVAVARRLLGLLARPAPSAGGPVPDPGGDPTALRSALPASRHGVYDPRPILTTVADAGTWQELRPAFGSGVVTGLARLGGQAVALVASHPRHLGGALDAPACDKLARFLQLADAFGLPVVTFVDSPGFMVGPTSEQTAMVRHAARVFIHAAALRVPVLSVVVRRGYGLGAMALTAGHFGAPLATAAWPTGEFGAMGLEGAVRLGFRRELEATPPGEREALFRRLLDDAIARGDALNMATHLEIDDVIDPAETRSWLLRLLAVARSRPLPARRPVIDAW
jgi:acetyl-CoA carboxylase carboxyltransferase component